MLQPAAEEEGASAENHRGGLFRHPSIVVRRMLGPGRAAEGGQEKRYREARVAEEGEVASLHSSAAHKGSGREHRPEAIGRDVCGCHQEASVKASLDPSCCH